MKTRLFDSDVLLMLRVQHAIDDYLAITPYSDFTDYEHQLVSISSSIEKLLYLHTSSSVPFTTDDLKLESTLNKTELERAKKLQSNVNKIRTSMAYDGFRRYLLTLYKNKK